MVCSLHSVTTGSRDRANVPLIIIIIHYWYEMGMLKVPTGCESGMINDTVPSLGVQRRRRFPLLKKTISKQNDSQTCAATGCGALHDRLDNRKTSCVKDK